MTVTPSLPRMLLLDKGSANTSTAIKNLLDAVIAAQAAHTIKTN